MILKFPFGPYGHPDDYLNGGWLGYVNGVLQTPDNGDYATIKTVQDLENDLDGQPSLVLTCANTSDILMVEQSRRIIILFGYIYGVGCSVKRASGSSASAKATLAIRDEAGVLIAEAPLGDAHKLFIPTEDWVFHQGAGHTPWLVPPMSPAPRYITAQIRLYAVGSSGTGTVYFSPPYFAG